MILPLCLAAAAAVSAPSQSVASPWFGTWSLRLKAPDEKPETLIYSDAGGGAMRMVSVEQNSIIVTRFDGRPAPNQGTKTDKPQTLAITAEGPTRYRWTFALDGKPWVQGVNTLAPDRKTFTEVSWLVGKPEKKVTLIYERR